MASINGLFSNASRCNLDARNGTVTWLPGVPEGTTDWERLATLHPEPFAALAEQVGAAWRETDPELLELARLRIAALLRNAPEMAHRTAAARAAGLSEAKVGAVANWPTSLLFDERDRACLALAEQLVVDANGVTDDVVAAVTAHLGAQGCYAFVEAVSTLETFQRACLTLGITTGADVDSIVIEEEVGDEAKAAAAD